MVYHGQNAGVQPSVLEQSNCVFLCTLPESADIYSGRIGRCKHGRIIKIGRLFIINIKQWIIPYKDLGIFHKRDFGPPCFWFNRIQYIVQLDPS